MKRLARTILIINHLSKSLVSIEGTRLLLNSLIYKGLHSRIKKTSPEYIRRTMASKRTLSVTEAII